LQACADTMMANSVHDRFLSRRLPTLVRACGFMDQRLHSHGYVETQGAYMPSIVERSADMLRALGQIGEETAAR
jgi:hypothetical protein